MDGGWSQLTAWEHRVVDSWRRAGNWHDVIVKTGYLLLLTVVVVNASWKGYISEAVSVNARSRDDAVCCADLHCWQWTAL